MSVVQATRRNLQRSFTRPQCVLQFAAFVLVFLLPLPLSSPAFADSLDESVWLLSENTPADVHLASTSVSGEGQDRGLRLRFVSRRDFQKARLESRHPAAFPLDEFQATLRFSSSTAGARFGLKLVLPQQEDPRTSQPLTTVIPGARYSRAGQWQTLTAGASAADVEAQLRRVRAELHRSDINVNGAYIDGCVLLIELNRGDAFLEFGETTYGPVVKPPDARPDVLRDREPGQNPVSAVSQASSTDADLRRSIEIERSQVFVNGSPVFLRLAPDHGESIDQLESLGLNAVWVHDYRNLERQRELLAGGLAVVATPPHPLFDPADFETPLQGLPPLEHTCPLASAFCIGTRVSETQLEHLMAWALEVESADRVLRRPLMVDMTTGEGIAAREIDLVGLGEHMIGRTRTFGEARNQTHQRRRAASQLTLPWTWLQTEHSADLSAWRAAAGFGPIPIEPEQLTMQLIAALSGGCRGIGFWKTKTLAAEVDGTGVTRETALAIELTNLYLGILEPFLVEGRVEGHIAVQTSDQRENSTTPKDAPWLAALSGSTISAAANLEGVPDAPDAAVIRSGANAVILAAWWDNASQFVPHPMYAPQAQLTVAARETASAWRVTATSVSSLRRNMTAGGLRLDVPDLDQFAIFLVSSDPEQVRQLERRIQKSAQRAAQIQIELTRLKYERVLRTTATIDELGHSVPQTRAPARQAAGRLDQADAAFARDDFQSAERLAREAARHLRSVQQQYWVAAVSRLPSPTASPHTVAFASLPDHWRMLDGIAATGEPSGVELLTSADFESLKSIEEADWSAPRMPEPTPYRSTADVVADRDPSQQSQRFLRLLAARSATATRPARAEPSQLVLPPAVRVEAGDVLEISGRVRMGTRFRPEDEFPLMIFDDDLGPKYAVQPALEPSWRRFQIYRQASRSGRLQISFVLNGQAEVHLDDISVTRVSRSRSPQAIQAVGHATSATANLFDHTASRAAETATSPGRRGDRSQWEK